MNRFVIGITGYIILCMLASTNGPQYRFIRIQLENNALSGTLPPELGLLPLLQVISVENNNAIHGTIPSSLSLLTNLQVIHLEGNQLSSTLPSSLSKLNNLCKFIFLSFCLWLFV